MKNVKIVIGSIAGAVTVLAAAPALASGEANLGALVTVTPVSTSGDSVNAVCDGVPAGGSLGSVDYVLHAEAQSSSTTGDVALATGVTCRIWNNVSGGGWLSEPISGSEPGAEAVAVGLVSIRSNTNPIACVYPNALFTGNHTAGNRSGSPCPTTP